MNIGIHLCLFHDQNFWITASEVSVDDYIKNHNGDVHSRDGHGKTPLHWAAEFCAKPEVIASLLKEGADIHVRDKRGRTPLHFAAIRNIPEIVEFLLNKSASGATQDADGKTPFDYAQKNDALKGSKAYWQLNDAKFNQKFPTSQ